MTLLIQIFLRSLINHFSETYNFANIFRKSDIAVPCLALKKNLLLGD